MLSCFHPHSAKSMNLTKILVSVFPASKVPLLSVYAYLH